MALGRFCWFDLISLDPEKSLAFLHSFLAIEGKRSPDYTELSVGGEPFGGVLQKRDEGASAWVGYLHVADLDASLALAEKLGARVFMRAQEIPGVGRFSFLQDPQGAYFYLFQATVPLEEPKIQPGMVCWCELRSQDPKGSAAFYTRLMGYKTRKIPHYTMLQHEGKDIAGLVQDKERTGWLFYFLVENVKSSADEAVKLGGIQRHPPTSVPGWGSMAVVEEPTGAVFALWEPAVARV